MSFEKHCSARRIVSYTVTVLLCLYGMSAAWLVCLLGFDRAPYMSITSVSSVFTAMLLGVVTIVAGAMDVKKHMEPVARFTAYGIGVGGGTVAAVVVALIVPEIDGIAVGLLFAISPIALIAINEIVGFILCRAQKQSPPPAEYGEILCVPACLYMIAVVVEVCLLVGMFICTILSCGGVWYLFVPIVAAAAMAGAAAVMLIAAVKGKGISNALRMFSGMTALVSLLFFMCATDFFEEHGPYGSIFPCVMGILFCVANTVFTAVYAYPRGVADTLLPILQ